MKTTLYYIYDPMCSWCYAFSPTLQIIKDNLSKDEELIFIPGGLARPTNDVMPKEMQENIENIWYEIEKKVGTKFNHDFWDVCKPRRSTYIACQSTIAARLQNKEYEMIQAIQEAYYQRALNPSDDETHLLLAKELNLDTKKFEHDLNSEEVKKIFKNDINQRRSLNVRVFPTLLLKYKKEVYPINIEFNQAHKMLEQIKNLKQNQYF